MTMVDGKMYYSGNNAIACRGLYPDREVDVGDYIETIDNRGGTVTKIFKDSNGDEQMLLISDGEYKGYFPYSMITLWEKYR